MSESILVINAGSSSIKFAVFAVQKNAPLLHTLYRGKLTGIGQQPQFSVRDGNHQSQTIAPPFLADTNNIHNHDAAFSVLFAWLDQHTAASPLTAIGHRVVHGGDHYSAPVMVTDEVLHDIEKLIPLAPLHQPYHVSAIRTLRRQKPGIPQVVCFDTAFHRSQPFVAQQFALPIELQQQGILRYGFHGLSYEYIASVLPEYLGAAANGRVIVAHLGHGASMCAIKDGRSVATTMSFSPLDGLPMGSRCGSLDAAVVIYLMREKGMDITAVDHLLNYESGLLGVSGISDDMRVLLEHESPLAAQAVDLFVYRASRELGSLAAAMGGLDALIFTAGIGEHAAVIRERICQQASWLGLQIDVAANADGKSNISTTNSKVSAWVIPTNEEQVIAEYTVRVVTANRNSHPNSD